MTLALVPMAEWETCRAPVDELSDSDRQLASALREADGGRIIVDERRDGVWVTTRSWVGVVRFTTFELRIVPKLAGGNVGVARMLQYAAGLDVLKRHRAERTLDAVGSDLLELIAWLFVDECERLIGDGLLSDYVARQEALHLLRGRLLVLEQLRRQYGRVDPLEVAFDEFETDVPENQVLAAAAAAIRGVVRWPELQRRSKRIHSTLADVADSLAADPLVLLDELVYTRRNSHYRPAHVYAGLLLRRLAVRDLLSVGGTTSFAFLLDMNELFESFVTRLVRDALEPLGIRVHAQRRDPSIIIDESTNKRYSAIIPDLLLESGTGEHLIRLPVDSKNKLYDAKRIQEADVYQTFLYAFAYASPHRGSARARAVILYPRSGAGEDTSLRVDTHTGRQAGRIQAFGVDIEAALAALEAGEVITGRIPGLGRLLAAYLETKVANGEITWLAS
jgi:5-methylcytosine-specific restriction enzyme subunit McrC